MLGIRADPEKLHAEVNALNEEREIFKGKIGLHDIVLAVNAAKDVAGEVEGDAGLDNRGEL